MKDLIVVRLPVGAIVALAGLLPGIGGCAWVATYQPQIDSTLAVVGRQALATAAQTLIASAVSEADAGFKANYLDSLAAGFRANEADIVTSSEVEQIVKIWAPDDGRQWQQLGFSLAQIYEDALAKYGQQKAAAIVEQIAAGLNQSAADTRTDGGSGATGVNSAINGTVATIAITNIAAARSSGRPTGP